MSAQIIEKEGKPEYAVIPYSEYEQLLDLAESAQDQMDGKIALGELARGEDEVIPGEVVDRFLEGKEHPLKIWREYRGLTQETLGRNAEVGKSYISQIEAGKKVGSAKVLRALAVALRVDIDDLLVDLR
jgi:DNA-binding XRE family transcriptional regulator